MTTILHFKNDDVMKPQPYPVAYNDEGIVTSGLLDDDGSYLVGFGTPNEFDVTVFRGDATPTNVLGLEPVFSDGNNLFRWRFQVREVVVR